MFNLNKHLDSNEKVIEFFRPSRKAYIFHYIWWAAVFIFAIFLDAYKFSFFNLTYVFIKTFVALFIMLYAVVMLLKIEYGIFSRRYALTNERLMYSVGIFSEKFKSASYKYITDVGFYQNMWDKIINTGTLTVNTAGTDMYEIRYRKINDPLKIKKIINDNQEEHKQRISDQEKHKHKKK